MAIGWLVLIPAGIWMSTAGRSCSHWRCTHAMCMITATILIVTAAICAWSINMPHFSNWHEMFGPVLIGLLLLQVVGGAVLYFGGPNAIILKIHRLMGLVIYLGGLAYGSLVLHTYACGLTCPHAKYGIAMLMGFLVAVHGYLIYRIVPAWWALMCGNYHYEAVSITEPVLPTADDQV